MKKLLQIILWISVASPLFATTITCRDTLEIVMDGQAVGRFEDAVANHPALATDIRNAVKAVVEAKAASSDTVKDAVKDEARTSAAGITLSSEAQAAIEAARIARVEEKGGGIFALAWNRLKSMFAP